MAFKISKIESSESLFGCHILTILIVATSPEDVSINHGNIFSYEPQSSLTISQFSSSQNSMIRIFYKAKDMMNSVSVTIKTKPLSGKSVLSVLMRSLFSLLLSSDSQRQPKPFSPLHVRACPKVSSCTSWCGRDQ